MGLSFEEKRTRLIKYLLVKISEADWHGAADCCVDIRVLEAEHNIERHLLPFKLAYEELGKRKL